MDGGRERDYLPRYDERAPQLRPSPRGPGRRSGPEESDRPAARESRSSEAQSWIDERRRSVYRTPREDSRSTRPPRETEDRVEDIAPGSLRSRRSRFEAMEDPYADPNRQSASARTRDPYDRLRSVGQRPARPVSFDDAELQPFPASDETFELPRTRRRASERAEMVAPGRARTSPVLPQAQFRQMGSALAARHREAGPIGVATVVASGSLLLLALFMLIRSGSVDPWHVARLNAAGEPSLWASTDALWRIPLLLLFATVAGAMVAFRLRAVDAFAARFVSVTVLMLHGLGWVAAGHLLV